MIGVRLPEMWSWDITGGNRSACGITGLREVAQAELLAVMEGMPPGGPRGWSGGRTSPAGACSWSTTGR